MILPGPEKFSDLARQGNLIPVWKSVPADLLTPVSAYLKLTSSRTGARHNKEGRNQKNFSFLFESVEGGETIARYTYLGADPFLIVRFRMPKRPPEGKKPRAGGASPSAEGKIEIIEKGRARQVKGDLMEMTRELLASFRPVRVDELPPFSAGAVGYMAYDLISLREPVRLKERAQPGMPDAVFMFFSTVLVFDHVKHQITIICNVRCEQPTSKKWLRSLYSRAEQEIQRIEKKLQSPLAIERQQKASPKRRSVPFSLRSNISKGGFIEKVRQAKQHIQAGDIFQVVLSQRLETKIRVDPFEIYRALRRVNPSPYLFFLRMGDDCVLGSSPEMLVKVSGEDVEYRPIAGTRPRGKTPEQDKQLEQELLGDEKERAEHVMLVDLGRNDVGRVCRYGTVEVPEFMFVERYSHVMHLVSSVRGKLRPEVDAWDTLWACFPAGTVSGAPKVRAMQIISELEPARRGVYAGAVLYLDFSGNLNSCISIRTMVVTGGKACIQAGAGIVADSVPEKEYEETLNKGKALLQAVEMAQQDA